MIPVEQLVDDGDIIATQSKNRGLPALTRFFTHSPYTHTGIVVVLQGVPWVAEMNAGGNVLVPFKRFAGKRLDVFSPPVERWQARYWTLASLDGDIHYDFVDLVRIALFNAVQLKLPRTDQGGMVCSAYTASILRSAGWTPPPSMPSIPSPADLVRALAEEPRISAGDG